jgi:hypothetical protein
MATTTETQQRAVTALRTVELMLGDLPEVAAEWEQLDGGEREGWSLDWSNEMSGLKRLGRYASDGVLTAEQMASYRRVLRMLIDAQPTIERLNLYLPPIPIAD